MGELDRLRAEVDDACSAVYAELITDDLRALHRSDRREAPSADEVLEKMRLNGLEDPAAED